MKTQRVVNVLRPSFALVALALALIVVGLALTGTAAAASSQPYPSVTPLATGAVTQSAIVQFGEDVTVAAGERVETVFAGGGDVTIDGTVAGSVVALGGDVLVNGTVEKDIIAFGGDVRLTPTAVVGRAMSPQDKAIVLIGGELSSEPGAQVTGGIQRADNMDWPGSLGWLSQRTVIKPWWGFSLMGWIVQTAFFLVLGLVAAALMPRQLRAVQRRLSLKPAGSLGWGALIFFVAGPAVLVVLVISIVGWLIVIPYVLLAMLVYFFATTAVAAFVAQRVLSGSKQSDNLMLAVTLGVVGATILSRIPVLGSLVIVAMIVFGTGAIALALVEWRRARKLAAAPAPAGAPLAATAGAAPVTQPVPVDAALTAATIVSPAQLTAAAAEAAEPVTAVTASAIAEGPAAEEPESDEPPAEEPAAESTPEAAPETSTEATAADEASAPAAEEPPAEAAPEPPAEK